MRLNISIDDTLLNKVDEYCGKNNYGRSELIAELLRHRIMGVDITPIQTGTMPVENEVDEFIETSDKIKTIVGQRYDVTAIAIPMWCQGHFEQGVTHTCYKVSYEDENGAEILKDKWLCEKCVRSYMNKVGKVYGHRE